VQCAGDAEVSEECVSVLEKDVLRLDVAVDHACAVRAREGIGCLGEDPDCGPDGECWLALESLAERFTFDVGRDVVKDALPRAGGEDREDVRVLEMGGERNLALEPGRAHLARQLRRQHFHHDPAVE
jgi:hypothetical protein